MDFRVVQGCPVDKGITPYIAISVNDAHANVTSIYRGDDARAILNAHGKHSQQQLYDATPAERQQWGVLGQPAKPGQSTHELRSDGRAFPAYPVGARIPWWAQGFDIDESNGPIGNEVIRQAAAHHWHIFRPYPGGTEHHHLCFLARPMPTPRTLARIVRLRATLPRS